MIEDILISVIIPTFNSAKTLENALNSVISQRYKNIEIVVVDGDSDDSTLEILKKYGERIRYISEKDNGIYDAMNKGVEISSGDFLYFLGSDDELTPEFSNLLCRIQDINTIYYSNVLFKEINEVYDGQFTKFKILRRNISHQAILYPKVVFKKYRYNLKYQVLADYMLNLLCFSDKSLRFHYINLVIAKYSLNGYCGSGKNFDKYFYNDVFFTIYQRYGLLSFIYYFVFFRIKFETKNILRKFLK